MNAVWNDSPLCFNMDSNIMWSHLLCIKPVSFKVHELKDEPYNMLKTP